MRKILSISITVLCLVFSGCSKGSYDPADPPFANSGAPRMVISGSVTNSSHQALQGIYVSVPGVRESDESDILTYNYAITDSAGQYTIIRYRGRELPTEVTVVATDSSGLYQEQYIFAPVTYDSIFTSSGRTPYNAYVKADFVLLTASL